MFSFVIPCYNGKAALDNTLQSLFWQEKSIPFEVILVDNNSSRDNLDELYEAYKDKLNLYLIKQPKLKTTYALSRARNLGLKLSQYPWMITLDSDIILPPHYLTNLSNYINTRAQDQSILLTAERIFISRADIEPLTWDKLTEAVPIASSSNYNRVEDRRLPYLKQLTTTPHPWAFFHGCNTIFKTQNAIKAGGFDEEYDGHWGYEDIDFAYRIITRTDCKPVYLPSIYCYHQEEEHSAPTMIDRFDKSKNPNWTRICNQIPGFKEFKRQQYQSLTCQELKLEES
ncbi:MAG: glycosyltransferase [Cyanobacteria bacterium J06592_8]